MLTKPDTCSPCVLNKIGSGFGTLIGPSNADMLFVGEALGIQESLTGKPFVGPAGSILNKVFRYVGIDRDDVAIHNIVNCHPPSNNLVGTSYEHEAINSCSQYINRTLDEGSYKVVVGLGAVAAKQLLGLYGTKGVSIFELHGAPARDKSDQYWIIPTVHPSFILHGSHSMFGVLAFDIMKALEIARDGFDGDKANLIIDPGWAAWDVWVKETIAKAQATQNGLWLAVDIETPLKHKNSDESDNVGFNIADSIYRVNFSCDENEAITVPFDDQHMVGIKALLAHPKIKKAFWYMNFDKPNLEKQGVPVLEPCYDMMYGFHLLQSDLRMGLGFVSPFYSNYGPWKHLTDHKVPVESLTGSAADNYKVYSAVDGLQTIRNTYGIERDLRSVNLWDIFERHIRDLDRFVLRPAEKVGLLFNRTKLKVFKEDLTEEELEVGAICTKFAPPEIIPPENTWKTNKASVDELGRLRPGHKEITESTMCDVCQSCGAINVNKTHSKSKKCFGAKLKFETHVVTKWIKEGAFNPNSPKQVLAYIKYKGHKPGKQKKSLNESSDIQTLEKLKKKHPKDLMYAALMKMRKITKMKGTYCDGILSRGDATNRVHAQYTNIPSTFRLSCKDPNLTNLVAKDKKEDENQYGKRFRECIIASPGCVLLEGDYGGIEAVQTGWFAKDPDYIRLAKLSVHAYLTSHVVGKPANLHWDNAQLKGYLNEIKEEYFLEYNKCKRVVHGCLTPGHEVLTKTGWIPIEYLEEGMEIAQWDEDQEISFVVPTQLHQYKYDGDIHIKSGRGLSIRTTPNHRFPIYKSGTENLYDIEAQDLEEGKPWRVPISGELSGGTNHFGFEEALSVAAQADGSVYRENHVRFHLVKSRKIERLLSLLKLADKKYNSVSCNCHADGVRISFSLSQDKKLIDRNKNFNLEKIMNLSSIGRREFLKELIHWDGSIVENRQIYLSTNYHNATIVQTIAHLSSRQGLLRVNTDRDRSYGNKPLYSVSLNKRKCSSLSNLEIDDVVENIDTTVYCVTVPSSWFLVRHNNRISVTGNSAYMLSAIGLSLTYPEVFKNKAAAKEIQDIFFSVAPGMRKWQLSTIEKANVQRYLGGTDHPYKYKHWFYDVLNYARITEVQAKNIQGFQVVESNGVWYKVNYGKDAKRCVAFYPQSTAGGNLKEAMLQLFTPGSPDFIGDCYYGSTPLRAPIHDSLLLEVPKTKLDFVAEKMYSVMTRPIPEQPMDPAWGLGSHLTIDVNIEVGKDWSVMEKMTI